MYDIFTYIWLKFMVNVNVGKYTIHGSYGIYSFFAFNSYFWGEMNQFDEYVYSKVWFDHQLVNFHRSQVKLSVPLRKARLFLWLHGCVDLFVGRKKRKDSLSRLSVRQISQRLLFPTSHEKKQCDDMFEKMMIHSLKQELMWPNGSNVAPRMTW